MQASSRQHVLSWLDKQGSAGRSLADKYRSEQGLRVKDRCTRCGSEGHYYICPTADRLVFSCSNYTDKDNKARIAKERDLAKERDRKFSYR